MANGGGFLLQVRPRHINKKQFDFVPVVRTTGASKHSRGNREGDLNELAHVEIGPCVNSAIKSSQVFLSDLM